MTEEQKSEIMLLRRQGVGYKRIAAIMEISVETVKSYCRRNFEENATKPVIPVGCEAAAHPKKFQFQHCAGCGTLLPMGSVSRKYCSHACYIRHRFGRKNHA